MLYLIVGLRNNAEQRRATILLLGVERVTLFGANDKTSAETFIWLCCPRLNRVQSPASENPEFECEPHFRYIFLTFFLTFSFHFRFFFEVYCSKNKRS